MCANMLHTLPTTFTYALHSQSLLSVQCQHGHCRAMSVGKQCQSSAFLPNLALLSSPLTASASNKYETTMSTSSRHYIVPPAQLEWYVVAAAYSGSVAARKSCRAYKRDIHSGRRQSLSVKVESTLKSTLRHSERIRCSCETHYSSLLTAYRRRQLVLEHFTNFCWLYVHQCHIEISY